MRYKPKCWLSVFAQPNPSFRLSNICTQFLSVCGVIHNFRFLDQCNPGLLYWGRTGCHNSHWLTVQGKLLYAACSWSGFCTAGDRVRLNSFIRRCWKLGYSKRSITFEDMCDEAEEQLFDRLINDTNHVLHRLLPQPTTASQRYNLRSRTHTIQLPEHSTRLPDSNFLVRMLYRDCY